MIYQKFNRKTDIKYLAIYFKLVGSFRINDMLNYGWPAIVALWVASSINPFLSAADPILPPSDTDLIRDRQERLLQDQQKRLDELQQLPQYFSSIQTRAYR